VIGLRETSANLDRYFSQEERAADADFVADTVPLNEPTVKLPEERAQSISSSQNPICRICLSEEDKKEGHEFYSLCKCAGSLQNIGISCLKEWLSGKRHCKETSVVNSYIWKGLECEICKHPYPDEIIGTEGQNIKLLDYQIHKACKKYLILESITNTTSKTIHVCNFDEQALMKVGRAPVADIRITDISVSRFHSNLYLCKDGTLCVVDNFSKFGTMKLIQEPLEVSSETQGPIYV